MFAGVRRLGVVLVLWALALVVGSASAWAHGLTRTQARELRMYDSGLVLARPGAGPALRRAGGVKLTNRLPLWSVPSSSALQVLPGLLRSNLVSDVAANQPLSTLTVPPISEGADWWIPAVGANAAPAPGPGKPLTIIDTGIDLTHEEFAGRVGTTALNTQNTATSEEEAHGTAVASMAAAPLNNLGILGTYPQASLYAWDASPNGVVITAGDVVQGLDAAIRQGAGVVNLSLGSQVQNPLLDRMIAVTQSAGVLVVAAAGNSRQQGSPLEYPASDPHVVTVGATDANNQPAFYTSGSTHVDLAAPGDLVWAAIPVSADPAKYEQVQGTSFASPIVAAAADWVWTVRPTLDWTQVAEVLRASAQDMYTPGFDPFSGFGRLNIPAALAAAPAAPDPQEPNEDVSYVKPGGFLHRSVKPLTAVRRKNGSVTARLDFGDDPRDVYRIWIPGKHSAAVALQPIGGDVDLAAWGPEDRERARIRSGAEARCPRALGALRDEARTAAGQERGPQRRVLLRRGLRRERRREHLAARRRDRLQGRGLDRQDEARTTVAAAYSAGMPAGLGLRTRTSTCSTSNRSITESATAAASASSRWNARPSDTARTQSAMSR